MTITQPATWNVLLYPPAMRKERRAAWKLLLPLMLMSGLMLFELMLFQAWMRGDVRGKLPMIAMAPLLLFGFLWLGLRASIWADEWFKRRLTLAEREVWLSPASPGSIPWKRIVQWEFEPVAHRPHLTKLSLVSIWGRKHPRRWPMILTSRSDLQKLQRELQKRKQAGADFEIIVHPEPIPPPPALKIQLLPGMWFAALGLYLFIHGTSFLAASIDDREAQLKPEVTVSENARDFVRAHFATIEDYRGFLRYSGTALTGAALLCFLCAFHARPLGSSDMLGKSKRHTIAEGRSA